MSGSLAVGSFIPGAGEIQACERMKEVSWEAAIHLVSYDSEGRKGGWHTLCKFRDDLDS